MPRPWRLVRYSGLLRAGHPIAALYLTPLTSISLPGEWYIPLDDILEIARQEAHPYLDRIAVRLEKKGLCVRTATQMGGVASAIIEYAEANSFFLLSFSRDDFFHRKLLG